MKASAVYLQVFDYIEELDAFAVNKEFGEAATALGLNEWHETVWIGRYFLLDNDFGEHWFDNWPERDAIERKAKKLGLVADFLMVIDPSRFQNGSDGPCHTDEERKQFWRDVLINLKLSLQTLFNEGRKFALEASPFEQPEEDEIVHSLQSLSEVEAALLKKHCPHPS
jgi:hypothetical protein